MKWRWEDYGWKVDGTRIQRAIEEAVSVLDALPEDASQKLRVELGELLQAFYDAHGYLVTGAPDVNGVTYFHLPQSFVDRVAVAKELLSNPVAQGSGL